MQSLKLFMYIFYPVGLICLMTAWTIMTGQLSSRGVCDCSRKKNLKFSNEYQSIRPQKAFPLNVNDTEYVRDIKEVTYKPDEWNNSDALYILQHYNLELNNNTQPMTVDLKNLSTVTEWWQAAAMIDWYIHAPLRAKCEERNLRWSNKKWGVCQQDPWVVRKDCLVYSSVSGTRDFSTSDFLAFQGCDSRLFVPNIEESEMLRKKRMTFYKEGIGATNTNSFISSDGTPLPVRTLINLRNRLGHHDKIIDLLKIDFKGTEWDVLDYIMETKLVKRVRHLLVRYNLLPPYTPKENFVRYFWIMTRIRQLGFREYYSQMDFCSLDPKDFSLQGRVFYINVHFNWFL